MVQDHKLTLQLLDRLCTPHKVLYHEQRGRRVTQEYTHDSGNANEIHDVSREMICVS